MALHSVMQITFFVLLLIYGLAQAILQPDPSCPQPQHCGNVSIPFPFGIGPKCYLDESFAIDCSNGIPKAIFSSGLTLEVLEINFTSYYGSGGTVRLKGPIISYNCSNMETSPGLNITGSPFVFSYSNRFTAIGCDNFATLSGIKPMVVGCESDCNPSIDEKKSKCSGFNCCQSTIPDDLQVFDVSFRSRSDKGGGSSPSEETCTVKYAFLVDQDWFNSNMTDPSNSIQNMSDVPVVLNWEIYNRTKNSSELFNLMRNRRDASCYGDFSSLSTGTTFYYSSYPYNNFSSFFCQCGSGYEGNPYLSAGCKDINECENSDQELNQCERKWECVNVEGGYTCNKRKTRMKMVVVGISTSVGALILLFITWWLYNVIKKRNEIKLKKKFFKKNGGLLLQQQLSSSEGNLQNIKLFNSEELEKATDRFNESRILGQGGQGTVYKGMLVDGRIVAIKKSRVMDEANVEQFANEIVILSQVNHRNVVKLLGCCLETEVPLLVYEFIPNGTLFHYLHDQNEEFPLTWNVRLRIAREIAGALSYLHSAAALPIYHRDIKSTNVLLDDKYKAKVADFGTSRSVTIDQTHLTTVVHGTFGYLDPEYFQTSQFTEKSDVYSFGVVLVELLTGEKPFSSTRSEEGRSLATYFILSIKENHLFDILDARVMNEGKKEEIMVVANLAKRCLYLNGKKRPTMKEITMELEDIQKASNVQQNYEELEYVRSEETEPWDASTSTRSGLESGMASSSSDVLPLLSS